MTRRRVAAGLLVVAAVLFGIGTSTVAAESSGHGETEAGETAGRHEEVERNGDGERLLGIDEDAVQVA